MAQQTKTIDEKKLEAFIGKAIGDFGAVVGASLVVLGDRLGLYRALAEHGPLTSTELAAHTGTTERYIRDWLINQAAGGYVEYDSGSGRYYLSPEQEVALTQEDSPFFMIGGFQVTTGLGRAEQRIEEAFRTGGGMAWGEHHTDLFVGTERFFKPGYIGNLAGAWLPSLDGVVEKLEAGADVADVGCGHGASTIIMAKTYPRSRFHGYDNHGPSIERARKAARDAGVADRVTFEVAEAHVIPAKGGYDLIAFFDCFHDLGDPEGTARRARQVLKRDGTIMMVEPMAGDRVEDNFNPVGRVYSGASVLTCVPNSLAVGGPALGTIATDKALREVYENAGFTRFRRATETPVNRVFEVKA